MIHLPDSVDLHDARKLRKQPGQEEPKESVQIQGEEMSSVEIQKQTIDSLLWIQGQKEKEKRHRRLRVNESVDVRSGGESVSVL